MDKLDELAMNIGYCFMIMGAVIIGSAVLLLAAHLMNRAQHALVDCFAAGKHSKNIENG